MKVVYNNYIPVKGFKSITIFYWVFVRNSAKNRFTVVDLNHETIHFWQLVGCFILALILVIPLCMWCDASWWWLAITPFGFYLRYLNWCLKEGVLSPFDKLYKDLPFEREAYANQENLDYCKGFPPLFSWVFYIRIKRTWKDG